MEKEIYTKENLQEKHLKLQLKAINTNGEPHGKTINAIWFSRAQTLPNPAKLAYRLVTDHFQGVARAQLHIEALDEAL